MTQLALKPNRLHHIVYAFNGQMYKCLKEGGEKKKEKKKKTSLQVSKEISIEIKECKTVLHNLDITTVIHLPN